MTNQICTYYLLILQMGDANNAILGDKVSEHQIGKDNITVRSRPEQRNTHNSHHRSKSCENEEERKAILTLRRSHSLRRHDQIWDKKLKDEKQAEENRQSRPWIKPRKLNNSYWEKKTRTEEGLPPRASTPKIKLRETYNGRLTPVRR